MIAAPYERLWGGDSLSTEPGASRSPIALSLLYHPILAVGMARIAWKCEVVVLELD